MENLNAAKFVDLYGMTRVVVVVFVTLLAVGTLSFRVFQSIPNAGVDNGSCRIRDMHRDNCSAISNENGCMSVS